MFGAFFKGSSFSGLRLGLFWGRCLPPTFCKTHSEALLHRREGPYLSRLNYRKTFNATGWFFVIGHVRPKELFNQSA